MPQRLFSDPDALAAVCRRYHIRKLSLFGATLKGTNRPGGDVDLLVEFEPGAMPGLLTVAQRRCGQSVFISPDSSGLLIKPDVAAKRLDAETTSPLGAPTHAPANPRPIPACPTAASHRRPPPRSFDVFMARSAWIRRPSGASPAASPRR